VNFSLSSSSDPGTITGVWLSPDPPNGIITGYTVSCVSSATQTYPEIPTSVAQSPVMVDGDTLMTDITGLDPYTSYDCSVTASTSIGQGPASTDTVQTAQASELRSFRLEMDLAHILHADSTC